MSLKEILIKFRDRVKNSDVGSRMASGAFWSFTGTAIGKFIVLVAGILCARILGKEAYGQFGMVRSTINMFVVFGSAGLGMTASKYISEYLRPSPEKVPSIYYLTNGFAIITGLVVTIIVLLLAPILAENTLHCPELTDSLRIGAFMLFISVFNSAQNGTLSGFEDFKDIARNTFFASIAESIFMLLGAYEFGVFGAVLGYGMGFIVLLITNKSAINSNFNKYNISRKEYKVRKEELSILYKFSLPAALGGVLVMPVYWIARTMLVRQTSFGELAIYEVAEQWRTIIVFIPTALSQVVLPILSSIINTDRKKFWKVLNVNLLLNGTVTLIIAVIVCIFSGIIISLYGNGFNNPGPVIILGFSAVFSAVANVVGLSISSRGKMWEGFFFNLIWATIFLVLTKLFLNRGLGAVGLAWAFLISYFIHFTLQLTYLKCIDIKENKLSIK